MRFQELKTFLKIRLTFLFHLFCQIVKKKTNFLNCSSVHLHSEFSALLFFDEDFAKVS